MGRNNFTFAGYDTGDLTYARAVLRAAEEWE